MELTPEKDIYLQPAELDAQFIEKGMLAHFQNTCKARTVKVPKEMKWPTPHWQGDPVWEHNIFRDEDGVPQCRYKIKKKLGFGEEEEIGKNVHIVWYRDRDGQKYVAVGINSDLLSTEESGG